MVDVLLSNDIVVVDNTVIGDVKTLGFESNGVVAQSIGGGGGNGGFAVAGVLSGAGKGTAAVSVGIGGSGGDGGHSSAVKTGLKETLRHRQIGLSVCWHNRSAVEAVMEASL